MKRLVFLIGMMLFGIALIPSGVQALDESRDYDKYAVIYGGTMSPNELRNAYDNGREKSPQIKKIFTEMGISRSDMNGSFESGVVHKDGRVTVDGKTVATDASVVIRNLGGTAISGTNAGILPSSAMGDDQTAMVKMKDGVFQYAVMKPCGNPVTATPPKQPKEKTPPKKQEAKPSISIDKTVDGQESKHVMIDETFSYQVTVTNTGEVTIDEAVIADEPEAGVTLIESSVGTVSNNMWQFTVGPLAPGESVTQSVTAKVTEYNSQALKNTACVYTKDNQSTPDDCDDATVRVHENTDVCNPETGEILRDISKKEAENYVAVGSPECETMKVCDTESGKIVEVKGYEMSDRYSEDLSDCEEEPAELPRTGLASSLAQFLGAGSLAAASAYYVRSRA